MSAHDAGDWLRCRVQLTLATNWSACSDVLLMSGLTHCLKPQDKDPRGFTVCKLTIYPDSEVSPARLKAYASGFLFGTDQQQVNHTTS